MTRLRCWRDADTMKYRHDFHLITGFAQRLSRDSAFRRRYSMPKHFYPTATAMSSRLLQDASPLLVLDDASLMLRLRAALIKNASASHY